MALSGFAGALEGSLSPLEWLPEMRTGGSPRSARTSANCRSYGDDAGFPELRLGDRRSRTMNAASGESQASRDGVLRTASHIQGLVLDAPLLGHTLSHGDAATGEQTS